VTVAAPVGRAEIWRSLVATLDLRKSALILITGPPGIGRTHVLRRFGWAAREAGYTVAGCDEPLPIEPTTTVRDIARTLQTLVGNAETPPPSSRRGSGTWVSRAFSSLFDHVDDSQRVIATLDGAGPLCIGVDGYAPSVTVQLWISHVLVRYLRTARSPVLLLAVDTPGRLEALRGVADQVHELGPLDVDEVRAHLADAARTIEPPLSVGELDAYVTAGAADPAVFRALVIVLSAAAGGGSTR
jgi:hypothetical protein